MMFMIKPNRHAWLWWVSAVSCSIGVAIFVLLKPAAYELDIQRYRSMALMISFFISGLCIIIGTSNRWFGKDL